ncbi:hypothetical protein Y032_0009g698 [Ancylostoma ceylanicum]|uniref:Uncharacterized protein n=1 Tax=Ancylostoma ceylanicum TaxID=53326 RepID=A0A016VIY7_9BILA|nr:hypothetical protein Y032_0009g698 [Ancylostoma ceylanicum]
MFAWNLLIHSVKLDAPHIRLHLSIVETLNEYVHFTMNCGRHTIQKNQCFILPNSSGTNSPIPEGWMAWLATSAIKPLTVRVRSESLTTAPHALRARARAKTQKT